MRTAANSWGVAHRAKTIEQVRECYRCIRMVRSEASHMVCVSWLKQAIGLYSQDLADNREHGARRHLLDTLKRDNQ